MADEKMKVSKTDLLIIGAGPAGLMAANFAAAAGLQNVRIIDKRNDKIFTGQADGLQCRTLEVLQSFGLAEDIVRQANHMNVINFWNPVDGKLTRTGFIPDTVPGISRWQQVVLHQGRIERILLNNISRNSGGAINVERGILPEKMTWDESKFEDTAADNYPIQVQVRQLSEEEATPSQMAKSAPNGLFRSALAPDDTPTGIRKDVPAGSREVIHAKYVIGCEGAHSWTRKQIGGTMQGEQTDYIWGVLDAVPVTNFPDIRMRCAIHSEHSGSVMIIPREDGLVRFYIQLSEVNKGVDRHNISEDMILKTAQKIFEPYTLDISRADLNWWTAYQIGQRTSDIFSKGDRVFIAGDACHTHSPKAGQGMNTSMMDTYNLTWKLAAVIKNQSPRSILPTYTAERRRVAIDLINFDHKFSRLFSGRPAKDAADEAGISMDEFKAAFEKGNEFASGTAMNYCPSLITGKAGDEDDRGDGMRCDPPGAVSKETLTDESAGQGRIVVGKRFNTAKVMCQSDGRVKHFADWLPSDGRWKVIVFSGDIRDEKQKASVEALASQLGEMQKRFTPASQDIDSVIDVLTVSATPRAEVELTDYPSALRPMTTRYHQPNSGGSDKKALSQDYWKVFTDEPETWHDGPCNAYKTYGVPASGAVVVLRPDQYVALLVDLTDADLVTGFFEKCLLPGTQHIVSAAIASNPSKVDKLSTESVANLTESAAKHNETPAEIAVAV